MVQACALVTAILLLTAVGLLCRDTNAGHYASTGAVAVLVVAMVTVSFFSSTFFFVK
jgi:hypothetical protein